MSFTYGFYNSVNGDRRYNAEQMAAVFDCLINDGVQENIGSAMVVTPATGDRQVAVGTGRAWFNSTWSYNDAAYPLTLDAVTAQGYSRIDAICLVVDKRTESRANRYEVVRGVAGNAPNKPVLPTTDQVFYHALAYVTVDYGVTSIPTTKIENRVGTTDCPFITGILQTIDITTLLDQWHGQFDDWFEEVQAELTDDVAGALLNKINHLQIKETTMNKYGFSNNPEDSRYQEYPVDAVVNQIYILLNNLENKSKNIGLILNSNGQYTNYHSLVTIGHYTERETIQWYGITRTTNIIFFRHTVNSIQTLTAHEYNSNKELWSLDLTNRIITAFDDYTLLLFRSDTHAIEEYRFSLTGCNLYRSTATIFTSANTIHSGVCGLYNSQYIWFNGFHSTGGEHATNTSYATLYNKSNGTVKNLDQVQITNSYYQSCVIESISMGTYAICCKRAYRSAGSPAPLEDGTIYAIDINGATTNLANPYGITTPNQSCSSYSVTKKYVYLIMQKFYSSNSSSNTTPIVVRFNLATEMSQIVAVNLGTVSQYYNSLYTTPSGQVYSVSGTKSIITENESTSSYSTYTADTGIVDKVASVSTSGIKFNTVVSSILPFPLGPYAWTGGTNTSNLTVYRCTFFEFGGPIII